MPPDKPPPSAPALRRVWTRHLPPRARLPTAVVALAVAIIAVVVAPVYFGGYMRASGVVDGADVSAFDVGYAYTDIFKRPTDLLAAAPWSEATMTMLKPSFRPKQVAPPPGTPPEAFDAYILALTYLPRFEGTSPASPPLTSIELGLALYAFGSFNNGSRLAACCGYNGLALQFNGKDLPIALNRSIPWLAVEDTLLIPTSPRASLNYYPFDSYIAQAAIDMSFVTPDGSPDPFTETHIPWGLAATAPPTSLDVRVTVVLERDVPIPFITVRVHLWRTLFTKLMSVFVMGLLWLLGLSVFLVGLDVLIYRPRHDNLGGMGLALAALFALTPLRNTQMGIPPPMLAADLWAFFWAMLLVVVGAACCATAHFAYQVRGGTDSGHGGGGDRQREATTTARDSP